MSKIVFLYNPRLIDAEPFARDLMVRLARSDLEMASTSVWDEATARELVPGSDFVVTLGGDGTVLRAARIVVPLDVPLVGINLGRLGFLTEFSRQEAARKIPMLLRGRCWTEQRIVLAVEVQRREKQPDGEWGVADMSKSETFLAINEIVVGRAALARAVDVHVSVDDIFLTSYISDGAIVSTPTGSTAYSLAAGGPILHPRLENLLITPILAHLSEAHPFVCPAGAEIQLDIYTGHQAGLTIDGQVEVSLNNGDRVRAFTATEKLTFLRSQSPSYFYETLSRRLRWPAAMDDHSRDQLALRAGSGAPSAGGRNEVDGK